MNTSAADVALLKNGAQNPRYTYGSYWQILATRLTFRSVSSLADFPATPLPSATVTPFTLIGSDIVVDMAGDVNITARANGTSHVILISFKN